MRIVHSEGKINFTKSGANAYRILAQSRRLLKINPNTEYEQMSKKQLRSNMTTMESNCQAFRSAIIKKVKKTAEELNLSTIIVCTALTYLDLSLQRTPVTKSFEDYEAYGLVSLLLATKFHEGCQFDPKSSALAKNLRSLLQETVMKKIELSIASCLAWSLDVQTPVQFINYFICRGNLPCNPRLFVCIGWNQQRSDIWTRSDSEAYRVYSLEGSSFIIFEYRSKCTFF